MRRIHVVGRKNSGKTTLVVELVRHFTAAGLRVGTVKHTSHSHELDTPGKDSYQHRHAGAAVVGIFPRDIAETKSEQVNQYAQENQHPLVSTIEMTD